MIWFGAGVLLLVAVSGFAVVRTREVTEQVSGDPGDNVLRITIGVATFGSAAMWLLRP